MEQLLLQLRFSLRSLARSPSFTIIAVLTLGLGIGGVSAIFSVVEGVLLRPLSFEDPQRIVQIFEKNSSQGQERNEVSWGTFQTWEQDSDSFERLGAWTSSSANLAGIDALPERIRAAVVSVGTFPLLGVAPQIGRYFEAEDEQLEHRLVILSDGLWRRRYGTDPSIIGRTLHINGRQDKVIGVMPPGFRFPDDEVELWSLLRLRDSIREDRGYRFLDVIGRLRPEATLATAQAQLTTIAQRLADTFPDDNWGWDVELYPYHQEIVGTVQPALLILLASAALVLLIACANVTNLLLVRAAGREREIALSAALGANRFHLALRILIENMILTLMGGALGLAFAASGIWLLLTFNPDYLPRLHNVGIDSRVLAFTFLAALLSGLALGVVMALRETKTALANLQEGGTRSSAGKRRNAGRRLLVVVEIALSLALLIGASLMLNSLLRLQNIDPGFDMENVLTMQLDLFGARYEGTEDYVSYTERFLEKIRNLPGVVGTGVTTKLPLAGGDMTMKFSIEGRSMNPDDRAQFSLRSVSSDYLQTMGISLLKGRTLNRDDDAGAPRVLVINQTLEKRFWPDGDAVGRRLIRDDTVYEIVGVVADVRHWGLGTPTKPEIYASYSQLPYNFYSLVVKTAAAPEQLITPVRSAIRGIAPGQPAFNIRAITDVYADSIARSNFYTRLLLIFACVALVLAVVGLYGVVAYSFSQRVREIGIRIAIGADRRDVLRLVLGESLAMTAVGLALGIVMAIASSRVLASLLYGVSVTDPATFVIAALVFMVIALAATYFPARKTSRIHPMVILRNE